MSPPPDFNLVEYVVIGSSFHTCVYKLYLKEGMPHCYLVEGLIKTESEENHDWCKDASIKLDGRVIAYLHSINYCYKDHLAAMNEPATARCRDYIT